MFEGLLPEGHDDRLMNLLFVFAYWHALAKLRLHTDDTLAILDDWTTVLGDECRTFASETGDTFKTTELKREYEARKRRQARASKASKKSKKGSSRATQSQTSDHDDQTTPADQTEAPGPFVIYIGPYNTLICFDLCGGDIYNW